MGDRIALLKGGRLAQAGTAEEHYLRPVDLFAAGFFSELNLFDARVVNCRADTPVGQFAAPGHKDGDAVTVAVRLAGFDVAESGGEIEARVVSRRFLGVVGLLELAVPGAEEHVRARVRAGQLSPGVRDIWMNVRPSDVLVFERRRESA